MRTIRPIIELNMTCTLANPCRAESPEAYNGILNHMAGLLSNYTSNDVDYPMVCLRRVVGSFLI